MPPGLEKQQIIMKMKKKFPEIVLRPLDIQSGDLQGTPTLASVVAYPSARALSEFSSP